MSSLSHHQKPHYSAASDSDSSEDDEIMKSLMEKSKRKEVFSNIESDSESDEDSDDEMDDEENEVAMQTKMQVDSDDEEPEDDQKKSTKTKDLEQESDAASSADEQPEKPQYAFTITCKIDSDTDEDNNAELLAKIERKDRMRRKRLEEEENAHWIMSKSDKLIAEHMNKVKTAESTQEEVPRSKTGVKIIQPFDYTTLKKQNDSTGVIYLEKPQAQEYQNKRILKEHFSEYGEVTRIESDVILRGKKKIIKGYYIEFSSKDLAKRVALTLNNAPISRRDSRTLIIRYIDNFSWSTVQDDYAKKLMLRKLMRAQATNELKTIQTFEKRKKLSKQSKTKRNFRFAQKKFRDYVTKESNHHIDFMPFLGES